jgi:hypothetical protein
MGDVFNFMLWSSRFEQSEGKWFGFHVAWGGDGGDDMMHVCVRGGRGY